MQPLTELYGRPVDFQRCQICSDSPPSDDICNYQMWLECDEEDQPKPGQIIVTHRRELERPCLRVIEEHTLLYQEVPWSQGYPGWVMLLCGNCEHRGEQNQCRHPDLKANGGAGLLLEMSRPLGDGYVCYSGGHCEPLMYPFTGCVGKKETSYG